MTILIVFVSIVLLVLADQISKIIATLAISDGTIVPVIGNFLTLTFTRNNGAAWGIFSGTTWLLILGPAVAILLCFAALILKKVRHSTGVFALTLVMAGGIGNLIDRIFQPGGAVVDYIRFDFTPLFDFPVFNFADICVTFGAVFLGIYLLFFYEKEHPSKRKDIRLELENGGETIEPDDADSN